MKSGSRGQGRWRLSQRTLLILLFVLAFALRLALSYYSSVFGTLPFNYQMENFADFNTYYLHWLYELSTGALPYSGFFYQYPPLFLYILYPFYLIGGSIGASLSIILADSGSAVLIYLLVAKMAKDQRAAIVAGLAYALSPIALFYEGLLLLSTEPMLFFVLLAVYMLLSDKPVFSALFLAVAVLLKQEALFLLPVYLLYLRRYDTKVFAEMAVAFVGLILLVSAPFLVLARAQYISDLTYQTCLCVTYGAGGPLIGLVNAVVPWILPIVIAVTAAVLYTTRGEKEFTILFGAFLFALLLGISGYAHTPFRYYFIPVYALLLAAGRRWQAGAALFCIMGLSLILPPGPTQELLPFGALIVLVGIESLYSRTGRIRQKRF